MTQDSKYTESGAILAILDEYKKAIDELKSVIKELNINDLEVIVDANTNDKNCISIQNILTHVVRAGYNYVVAIRNWLGESMDYKRAIVLNSSEEYCVALDEMHAFNVALFEDYPSIKLEEKEVDKKIKVIWGQRYDVEQLFEHAIVHILRHRRQIERFILQLEIN